jgi:hypothetical protein
MIFLFLKYNFISPLAKYCVSFANTYVNVENESKMSMMENVLPLSDKG